MVITPFWDARAVSFIENPLRYRVPSFHSGHWDLLLAVVEAAGMPVCMHFGSGGAPVVSPDAPFMVSIAPFGTNSMFTTVELLLSKVLTKSPGLKIALSEGGIGWLAYILERVDYTWERHRWYYDVDRSTRPAKLFADHIYGCLISDLAGVAQRETIGVDNIMWEGDYHSESQWPDSRKVLAEALRDVVDGDAAKIAEGNARRLFNSPRR